MTVSNSSFVDTTAARGGAVDIACSNINIVSFERNSFKGNSAKNGSGGALYIYSPNVRSNESYCSKETVPNFITMAKVLNTSLKSISGNVILSTLTVFLEEEL